MFFLDYKFRKNSEGGMVWENEINGDGFYKGFWIIEIWEKVYEVILLYMCWVVIFGYGNYIKIFLKVLISII